MGPAFGRPDDKLRRGKGIQTPKSVLLIPFPSGSYAASGRG
jgi:hypothetical protein